jgi:hypothetical protein
MPSDVGRERARAHASANTRTRRCIHRHHGHVRSMPTPAITHTLASPSPRIRTVRFSPTGKPAVHGGTGVVAGSRGSADQLHDGLDPVSAESYESYKRHCNGARHICPGTALAVGHVCTGTACLGPILPYSELNAAISARNAVSERAPCRAGTKRGRKCRRRSCAPTRTSLRECARRPSTTSIVCAPAAASAGGVPWCVDRSPS